MKRGSYAYCIDNSGVYFVKIFQALGASYKKQVILGDAVFIVVRGVNTGAHFLKDDRVKYKFRKGSVHRAIIVHTIEKFRRYNRTYIWFPRNAVVLVNKNLIPLAKRIRLGIPREVVDELPSIGALCPVVM
jgi:large subunit ribosomal protein L14